MIGVFVLMGITKIMAETRPNILFAFADDWGRFASIYSEVDGPGTVNDLVHTPNFDRVAREGSLFPNAFVTAPSCTPCRSSILTGQYFFRTGSAAILQGARWNEAIASFPPLLAKEGYHIGETYKVWSPGSPADAPFGSGEHSYESRGGKFNQFSQNVTRRIRSGISVETAKQELFQEVTGNFEDFLSDRKEGQPFFYWFGPTLVHRKWQKGSGKELWGLEPDFLKGKMPPFLPDVEVVREDLADYFGEVMAFDMALGLLIQKLEAMGELDKTIIVISGDHGAPGFPRGKCNLYDFGTAVPLAIRWAGGTSNQVLNDFVNLMDLAPTFLEWAGIEIPSEMTGKSLVPILRDKVRRGFADPSRNWVITGRERHVAAARPGRTPYPQRALRTEDYLFILNFKPDRWPMGDPYELQEGREPSQKDLIENTFVSFPDFDSSPTKAWMVAHRSEEWYRELFQWGFGKRPEEEFYVLKSDPHQIHNRAGEPEWAEVKHRLRFQLMNALTDLQDPRVTGDGLMFETPPFAGNP